MAYIDSWLYSTYQHITSKKESFRRAKYVCDIIFICFCEWEMSRKLFINFCQNYLLSEYEEEINLDPGIYSFMIRFDFRFVNFQFWQIYVLAWISSSAILVFVVYITVLMKYLNFWKFLGNAKSGCYCINRYKKVYLCHEGCNNYHWPNKCRIYHINWY